MINKFILILIFSFLSINGLTQVNFSDLYFDSTKVFKNVENKIHQIDYFSDGDLCMQKFYPNGGSIGGFCHGSNLVHDSVLVHIEESSFVANFDLGSKSFTIYQWKANSNIVNIKSYNKSGNLTSSSQKIKIPDAGSAYPLCWYDDYPGGIAKRMHNGELVVSADYDKGYLFSYNFQDTLTINPVFFELKKKAIFILKNSYDEIFLSKNIIFNSGKSCYYTDNKQSFYSEKSPRHNSGNSLYHYKEKSDKIKFVDLTFDIRLNNYRFNCITLRFDNKGNLINTPVKLWKKTLNSSIGLTGQKIKKIISPNKVKKIAKKYSKWPIEGPTTINLVWQADSEADTLGYFVYEINYDFIKRGWNASYARQIIINAVDGKFLEEKETNSIEESVMGSRKIIRNGKWGFEDWGEIVIPAEYEDLPKYFSSFMIAKKNGKYGAINGRNEVLLDFEYDYIEFHKSSLERYKHWFLIITKNDSKGFYEKGRGILLRPEYKSITENANEQIIAVSIDGKQVVYNLRTGVIE